MVKKPTTGSSKAGTTKKQKQPTQKTPMQRIKVLGANGKSVRVEALEWLSS